MTETPLHQAFSDSARAPSSAFKAAFTRASESIEQKASRITGMAERHFEKHRVSWVAARYGDLLKKDSPAPSLKPHGNREDRTAHLVRAANHLANRKQQARLMTIKIAADRMIKGNDKGIGK
jgi:hypothetical protein